MCEFTALSQVSDYNFCLGSTSANFRYDGRKEVLLNGAVYTFVVDRNVIKTKKIVAIYHYLIQNLFEDYWLEKR